MEAERLTSSGRLICPFLRPSFITRRQYESIVKTGEALIIKGLKGFEHIDFQVDAKTPSANLKARQMADHGRAPERLRRGVRLPGPSRP